MTRPYEKQADQFGAIIRSAGGSARTQRAQTGTIYVTLDDFKVRFADHSDAHERADISVDPKGCTLEQALRACATATGLDLSRAIKSREAAQKAAATRAARRVADVEAKMAEQDATTEVERRRHHDRQRAAILARWPHFDSLTYKQRQRYRNLVNRQLREEDNA